MIMALMIEAAGASEKSINVYQTTWRNAREKAIFKKIISSQK